VWVAISWRETAAKFSVRIDVMFKDERTLEAFVPLDLLCDRIGKAVLDVEGTRNVTTQNKGYTLQARGTLETGLM